MVNKKRDRIVFVVITIVLLLFYICFYSLFIHPLVSLYLRVNDIEFKTMGNLLDIYAARYLDKPIYSSEFELFDTEKSKVLNSISFQNELGASLTTENCVITINSYEILSCIDTGNSFISSLFPSSGNGGILRLNITVQNNTDSVLSVRSKHFKALINSHKYKAISDYVGAVMLVEDLYESGVEPYSVATGNIYFDVKNKVFDSVELVYEVKDVKASVIIDTHNYTIDDDAINKMCSMVVSDMLR